MLKLTSKITLTFYQNLQQKTMKIPYQRRLMQAIYILTYYILSDWNPWIIGLKTTQNVFKKDSTTSFFLEYAKFTLQNNNIKFNNEFYDQIKDTVMGTIFAPTYATLLKGCFEIKVYSVCTFKYGELLVEHIKENWNSFLDDCYTQL